MNKRILIFNMLKFIYKNVGSYIKLINFKLFFKVRETKGKHYNS